MTNARPSPRTLHAWLQAVADGADPTAALQQAREAALDPALATAWIHLCPDAAWDAQLMLLARRRARITDRAALLQRYPLLGVPFAVKDNIDIAGEPTTAACPAFSHVASHTATVVQRLLDAGALWLGKTNLDQFATGLVGTRSPYGRPASVADASRISGGSSSGSAVVVAHGIVPFALGTDTAGSGRVPAGFNGLVGLKPTPGRISTAGVLPACRTLDCVSIFAHTVEDAAHVLAVAEGADAADAYSDAAPGPAALPQRLRLGVPRRADVEAASGYDHAWQAALAHAAALGHDVIEMDFGPLHEVAALLYEGPWVAERHAACRTLFDRQPEALDATVHRVIGRAVGLSATDAFEGQYRLRALRQQLLPLWDRVDALLVPTAPHHPTFAEVDADPVGSNARLGTYTNFVNLLGWCALAVPAARTAAGLPFGVTFIAPARHDVALHGAARQWMQAPRTPITPAALLHTPAVAATLPIAVVGAHLSGLPLNGQLRERGATLLHATTTAPHYRLYALPGTVPPKPGLLRVAEGGAAIALEVWAVPIEHVGSFLALIPPPLGLGSVQLADGRHVHGFICEPWALATATDVTQHGGWRAYVRSLAPTP